MKEAQALARNSTLAFTTGICTGAREDRSYRLADQIRRHSVVGEQDASEALEESIEGQARAQVGHLHRATPDAPVNERTEPVPDLRAVGRSESTTEAQGEQNGNSTGRPFPPDLARLVITWKGYLSGLGRQSLRLSGMLRNGKRLCGIREGTQYAPCFCSPDKTNFPLTAFRVCS